MSADYSSLEEFEAAVEVRLRPKIVAELRAEFAGMFEGVRAICESALADHSETLSQLKSAHASDIERIRASIPVMPNLAPFEGAIARLDEVAALLTTTTKSLSQALLTPPRESPAIAALAKNFQTLCAELDRPKIREGTAQLPGGGAVKLRIVETKGN